MHLLFHQRPAKASRFLAVFCPLVGFAITTSALHAQFSITSYSIDAGGGASSGGSFSLTGTAGQAEAAPVQGGAPFLLGAGFWGLSLSSTDSFASWVLENALPGQDGSFEGDADGNGIPNGIEYVFGDVRFEAISGNAQGVGSIPAPPSTPADVDISLELSSPDIGTPLLDWLTIISWEGGSAPIIIEPDFTSISEATVTDGPNASPFFYRYQINQR